ncbi:MAG: hypothetical protein QOC80_1957, partial [Frankiaceae bacterium]|nr:hypothetical protein [Frankiaceae bacterium]
MNDQGKDDEAQLRAVEQCRTEGMTRAEIARSVNVSTWRVTELLARLPPVRPDLRVRAKDAEREKARELRFAGRTMPEIAEELGVSSASVSLWTRDLPKPERKPYEHDRVAGARRARWDALLAAREGERASVKEAGCREVDDLTERELLLLGTALYWAEGSKSKPYRRKERLILINSDPDVIRVHMRWLRRLGFGTDDCSFSVSIHETADVEAAERYWREVVGPGGRWRKANLKRHRPETVRKNIGDSYHGCLVVQTRRSRVAYQRMEGLWRGIVEGLSGVV